MKTLIGIVVTLLVVGVAIPLLMISVYEFPTIGILYDRLVHQ